MIRSVVSTRVEDFEENTYPWVGIHRLDLNREDPLIILFTGISKGVLLSKNDGYSRDIGQYENFDEWESGRVYFDFNTAWSPAEPIVLEVSRQHPTLSFFWRYYEESYAFWGNHEIKNGKYLSQCESEFNSCVEYNDFGLTHHECLTCENWVDECNNSNEREIEMCESCQHEKENTEKEIAELEQELWG